MATTDVILREKVNGLGAEADVVSVKRGYARNYLIPQAKAFEATKGNLRHLEELKQKREERERKELEKAEQTARKLGRMKLKLELKTGQKGKAFGSITTMDIAKAIAEKGKGLQIDRHNILLDKPIKGTGRYDIPVKVHPEVKAEVRVDVSSPEPEEESS